MRNINKICVFDFETDGVDTPHCSPTELAAIMIEPRKLELMEGSIFESDVRPPDIDQPDYFEKHKSTILFHANNKKKSVDEILTRWRNAPTQEQVWRNFADYLLKYHTGTGNKTKFTAPIPAGSNIIGFDLPIADLLNQKYGIKTMWHMRDRIDAMYLFFLWFEDLDEPEKYNMDCIREFLGMSQDGAHTAIQDVKDTAQIILKMLKVHRLTAKKVIWNPARKRAQNAE